MMLTLKPPELCLKRFPQLGHWLPALAVLISLVPATLAFSQTQSSNQSLTLRADVQEADTNAGIITARGNVHISYPVRQVQATAAEVQYFIEDQRIVMSGNVHIQQEDNSLQGETITYLLDEGRFIALPKPDEQVVSVYMIPEDSETAAPNPSTLP